MICYDSGRMGAYSVGVDLGGTNLRVAAVDSDGAILQRVSIPAVYDCGPERVVEDAISLLAEGAKQVAEGAGAIGVGALLAYPDRFAGKRVGTPICGGNIDSRILANVLLRGLLRDGRLLRLVMDIPDRPGVLADIAGTIGGAGGNIIEVAHRRLFDSPSVQAAELEVMIEARDPLHGQAIVAALSDGYVVRRM